MSLKARAKNLSTALNDIGVVCGKKFNPKPFDYEQMEPENRFVTEVLRQKKLFMEKYDFCCEFYNQCEYEQYIRERDETIRSCRDLLKEIEATYNKLPISMGIGGL